MIRVLVVDDCEDSRLLIRNWLEGAGYEVAMAANGMQALEMQRSLAAQVVLTDIFMPDADGVETIRAIRSEFPMTGIIAMSGGGRHGADYLSNTLYYGASCILRKPFDEHALLTALSAVRGAGPAEKAVPSR